MKTIINILLIILIILIIYNLLSDCGCDLIEGLDHDQTNSNKTIQEIEILGDNCKDISLSSDITLFNDKCKSPNISATKEYACEQSKSCFNISQYESKITQMNDILKINNRDINLIGYLAGGPSGVPIKPFRFDRHFNKDIRKDSQAWDCDSASGQCENILPEIQDIPYYNTIILCYANFLGDADNPSIFITGQFKVNDTIQYKYTYHPILDCYKCKNCNPSECNEYCSQFNYCGHDDYHKKDGTNCTDCDYSKSINKYGKLDANSKAFSDNILKWKSADESTYKGPKRKVLMTFGGSADQMPQNKLKGDPNTSGTYTYNLLKEQDELDGKSILISFLDTWNLDGIDLDYEFSGNLSGNLDDDSDTGVKNNWKHIIQHLKKNKKIVYATPYDKSYESKQQQYNYLLNKTYMGKGSTIDVMQHQMYNGGIDWNRNKNEKWYNYLENVKKDIIPYNSNLTLESFGSIFTNYTEDRSINCWDLILYIEQIMDQIINNPGGNYVTNHGVFLIEYDYYYGYYFGKLIDSIRY